MKNGICNFLLTLEDCRSGEEDAAGATDRDAEEDVQHEAVDQHRHVLPVVTVLKVLLSFDCQSVQSRSSGWLWVSTQSDRQLV